MASLFKRSRLTGMALAFALGLTVLTNSVAPLLSYEVAEWLPTATEALANEPIDGG